MAVNISPGITVSLNGEDIQLEKNTKIAGTAFKLSNPVDIGTPADMATFVADQFGSDATTINASITALPYPLNQMAARLANIHVTVEDFEVTVPQRADANAPAGTTTFKVGLSGTWPYDATAPGTTGPIELIGPSAAGKPPVLAVKAIYLVVEQTA